MVKIPLSYENCCLICVILFSEYTNIREILFSENNYGNVKHDNFLYFLLAFGILMVQPQLFTHETTHPVCICAFYSFYVSVKEISMVDHSSTIIRFLIFAVTGLKQKSYLDPICRCTTYRMNCYAEGLVTMVTQRLLNKTEKVIRIALSLSWRKNTKRIRLPLLLSPHNGIKIFRKFALFWILFLALVIEYSSPLLWTWFL